MAGTSVGARAPGRRHGQSHDGLAHLHHGYSRGSAACPSGRNTTTRRSDNAGPTTGFRQYHRPQPDLAPPVSVRPLEAELAVLRQAQDDLRAGLPAQALRRLEGFERDHGPGSLDQERQAIAAIAFCQVRPGPTAQAKAEAFLRGSPDSPLAARVRSTCEKANAPIKQFNETERSREP